MLLDTLPVEPASISSAYSFVFDSKKKTLEVSAPLDSVRVCYRVLSKWLTTPLVGRDLSQYETLSLGGERENTGETPNGYIEKEELFDFGGINKYGAITRGVSFGNRQNVFVNAALNLQMNGQLDDNLFVTASITDQNIPYQPEGNTQQIRDFDNVFIKLYNDQFSLQAGDIVLQNPFQEGYFLSYYKNVQGLQASIKGGAQDGWKYESGLSGALSKGKFHSAIVQAVDGLNGPYKLRGPSGERFIIILANSEKVFLDGKQLERGFDKDYVIDYNLGEITFNNHLIITQFSVIRVDYEYAEQFYSRANLSAHQKVSKGNTRLFAHFYREKDNPNANLGFTLDDADLTQLRGIGDQADLAFVTGVDSVLFSENSILYAQKDTLDSDGNLQTIFIRSTDPNAVLYSPTFSEVGAGEGSYVLSEITSNGRVYQWVSPQAGVQQGDYTPGAFVPLPNQRQMVTVGAATRLSKYEEIQIEGAFSDRDNNLYSMLDDGDNKGQALFASFQSKGRPSFFTDYTWQAKVSMEYDQKDFTFIDRYRPILFERDWGVAVSEQENAPDVIFSSQWGLKKDEENQLKWSLNHRKRANQIDGWQQALRFNHEWAGFQFSSDHFLLSNQSGDQFTDWIRSKSDLSYRNGPVVPGVIYEVDQNEIAVQDSVVSSLMNFKATTFYLTQADSSKSNFRMSYQMRSDTYPVDGQMQDYLRSHQVSGVFVKQGRSGKYQFDANYRKVRDLLNVNDIQDEIINGRVNISQRLWKRLITHKFSYATGNSRALRRVFIYLPVNTGEGTHTWRDINGDGIQDLNEFFEAINPDERNYVKIFTPTDDYIVAFQTLYLHTLDIKMPATWKNQGAFKRLVSKLALNVNFNTDFKTSAASYADRLNVFDIDLTDESLVSAQDQRRYTLFFNRNGRGFAADFTHQTRDNKQLLSQGFELKQQSEWLLNMKGDISRVYTWRINATLGRLQNKSDFLVSRNIALFQHSIRPEVIWQPSSQLRFIGNFERKSKQNEFSETSSEAVTSRAYTGEWVWNKAMTGSLRARFSYISMAFVGESSSYLGYLLLDGLQPGTNQTWQANWQQRLSKGMQLSLIYNGRKSEGQRAIHTGTVQVTAFF